MKCGNPECEAVAVKKYCSLSCSAKINGRLFPKKVRREPKKLCLFCQKVIHTRINVYCNARCHKLHIWKSQIDAGINTARVAKSWLCHVDRSCQICRNTIWNGQPISLELDHINGDSTNNELSNLRLVCPNCHAQTPTYKGKNRGHGRHARTQRYRDGKSY